MHELIMRGNRPTSAMSNNGCEDTAVPWLRQARCVSLYSARSL